MLPSDTIVDRRRMVRYPAFARVKIQLSAPDKELFYRADVQDISRGGIKLRVERLFPAGTVGKVLLNVPLNARVVHASSLSDSDWVVGCVFARELNNGEFSQLRDELS
jgi:hypothetical protein